MTVSVFEDEVPFLDIAVFADPGHVDFFQEVVTWRDWVVVGFGQSVHFVSLVDFKTVSFDFDDYFGHLYSSADRLLVATAQRLICFDSRAGLLWRSDIIGIDGVLVDEIEGERISGSGEWDPPGGWRPFQLLIESGRPLETK